MIAFRTISLDEIDLEPLADEAWSDGYPFVERLRQDWLLGENRFEGPGECLIGAFEDDRLVGVCGLNRDPYVREHAARIRHLYVSRRHRHKGIGQALMARALAVAARRYPRIRLRATPASRRFYEHLGFRAVQEHEATHARCLR